MLTFFREDVKASLQKFASPLIVLLQRSLRRCDHLISKMNQIQVTCITHMTSQKLNLKIGVAQSIEIGDPIFWKRGLRGHKGLRRLNNLRSVRPSLDQEPALVGYPGRETGGQLRITHLRGNNHALPTIFRGIVDPAPRRDRLGGGKQFGMPKGSPAREQA